MTGTETLNVYVKYGLSGADADIITVPFMGHVIVLYTFVGPRQEGMVGNHGDCIR